MVLALCLWEEELLVTMVAMENKDGAGIDASYNAAQPGNLLGKYAALM